MWDGKDEFALVLTEFKEFLDYSVDTLAKDYLTFNTGSSQSQDATQSWANQDSWTTWQLAT